MAQSIGSFVRGVWRAELLRKILSTYVVLATIYCGLLAVVALFAIDGLRLPSTLQAIVSLAALVVALAIYAWLRLWPDLMRIFISVEEHSRPGGVPAAPATRRYRFLTFAFVAFRAVALALPLVLLFMLYDARYPDNPLRQAAYSDVPLAFHWAKPLLPHILWISALFALARWIARRFPAGPGDASRRGKILTASCVLTIALCLFSVFGGGDEPAPNRYTGGVMRGDLANYVLHFGATPSPMTARANADASRGRPLPPSFSPGLLFCELILVVPFTALLLNASQRPWRGLKGFAASAGWLPIAATAAAGVAYATGAACLPLYAIAALDLRAFLWLVYLSGLVVFAVAGARALRRTPAGSARAGWTAAYAVALVGCLPVIADQFFNIRDIALEPMGGPQFRSIFYYLIPEADTGPYTTAVARWREVPVGSDLAYLKKLQPVWFLFFIGVFLVGCVQAALCWMVSDGVRVLLRIARNFGASKPVRPLYDRVFSVGVYAAWGMAVLVGAAGYYLHSALPRGIPDFGEASGVAAMWGKAIVEAIARWRSGADLIVWVCKIVLIAGLAADVLRLVSDWHEHVRIPDPKPSLRFFALRWMTRLTFVAAGILALVVIAVSQSAASVVENRLNSDSAGWLLQTSGLLTALGVFLAMTFLAAISQRFLGIEASLRPDSETAGPGAFFGVRVFVGVSKFVSWAGVAVIALLAAGLGLIAANAEPLAMLVVLILGAGVATLFYVLNTAMPDLCHCLLKIEAHVRQREADCAAEKTLVS